MNKIEITGRLGKTPELKAGANGNEYTLFSVAVDRRKLKDKEQQTDWFNCKAFGKMAAFVCNYFHKGDGIEIVGRMEDDTYQDKNDASKKLHSWNVVIEECFFAKGSANGATKGASTQTSVEPDEDCPF